MKINTNLNLKEVFTNHIVKRKTMFIPTLFVSTFMLVGYAALDKEKPVIVSNHIEVSYGEQFDKGTIEVTDNRDASDLINVEVNTQSLNTNQLGSYEVEVTATDQFSNVVTKNITVDVVDQVGPEFEILGANEGYVIQVPVNGSSDFASYIKATDNVDGDVTPFIEGNQQLDASKMGLQTIILSASDSSGNISKQTYQFEVDDLEAPIVTLTKGDDVIIDYGSEFNGAEYISVNDNLDGIIAPVIEGTIDTKKTDEKQTLKITAIDKAGNKVESSLNVTIKDTSAPTITLSQDTIVVKEGSVVDPLTYLVSATDSKDGDIKAKVTMNNIDTNGSGSRTITYNVVDEAGNSVSATLNVTIDTGIGDKIAAAALAQLGVNQDCTMLVTNSLKAVGIYFHGWPIEYFSLGHEIPFSEAKPGDLIYYANGGTGLAHIAVYVGDGMSVHGGWHGSTVLYRYNYSTATTPRFIRIDR